MVHMLRVQLGYSRYQSASLLTCILHGQGFCLDGNRTGSTPKPNRIPKDLRLTGMARIAGEVMASVKSCGSFRQNGKSCPLGTSYHKANHPRIMGLLPLDS